MIQGIKFETIKINVISMSSSLKTKRIAEIKRNTKETQINSKIDLNGNGKSEISTGIAFFDHFLELFTRHSGVDLKIDAKGDLNHHLVEDVGIVIGQLIFKALGKKIK